MPVWTEDGVKYVQSNTILRMVCARGNMHSMDPATGWAIDSFLEAVEDNAGKIGPLFNKIVFGQGADTVTDEDMDKAKEYVDKLCGLMEKRLTSHGKKYLCGDGATAADCKIAAAFYAHIYNDGFGVTDAQRDTLKAQVAKYPGAKTYLEVTVPSLLGGYFATRPKAAY